MAQPSISLATFPPPRVLPCPYQPTDRVRWRVGQTNEPDGIDSLSDAALPPSLPRSPLADRWQTFTEREGGTHVFSLADAAAEPHFVSVHVTTKTLRQAGSRQSEAEQFSTSKTRQFLATTNKSFPRPQYICGCSLPELGHQEITYAVLSPLPSSCSSIF